MTAVHCYRLSKQARSQPQFFEGQGNFLRGGGRRTNLGVKG